MTRTKNEHERGDGYVAVLSLKEKKKRCVFVVRVSIYVFVESEN